MPDAVVALAKRRGSTVFHGGSGSEPRDIHEALSYAVKMNIDTDMYASRASSQTIARITTACP
jgi:fructose/tagatose bisphosphate aldolase